jgi:hypothetical protein
MSRGSHACTCWLCWGRSRKHRRWFWSPAGCAGAGPASTAAGSGLLLAVLGLVPQAPPLVLVSCWLRSGACPACAAAGVCVGVGVFVSLGNRGAPIGRRLPTVLRKVLMLVLC